jgi:hypothetical protein
MTARKPGLIAGASTHDAMQHERHARVACRQHVDRVQECQEGRIAAVNVAVGNCLMLISAVSGPASHRPVAPFEHPSRKLVRLGDKFVRRAADDAGS